MVVGLGHDKPKVFDVAPGMGERCLLLKLLDQG